MFVQKYSQLKPETWLRPFVNTAPGPYVGKFGSCLPMVSSLQYNLDQLSILGLVSQRVLDLARLWLSQGLKSKTLVLARYLT